MTLKGTGRILLCLAWLGAQIAAPILHLREHTVSKAFAAECGLAKGQAGHLHAAEASVPEAPCGLCQALAGLGHSLNPVVARLAPAEQLPVASAPSNQSLGLSEPEGSAPRGPPIPL